MSVAVYSRLGDLLRARGLGVEDLRRRIVVDTGQEVNTRALDVLAGDGRVRRPDIEVAGAAATALAVRLDDLFDVQVVPDAVKAHGDGGAGIDLGEWNPLGPEQSHRLVGHATNRWECSTWLDECKDVLANIYLNAA